MPSWLSYLLPAALLALVLPAAVPAEKADYFTITIVVASHSYVPSDSGASDGTWYASTVSFSMGVASLLTFGTAECHRAPL